MKATQSPLFKDRARLAARTLAEKTDADPNSPAAAKQSVQQVVQHVGNICGDRVSSYYTRLGFDVAMYVLDPHARYTALYLLEAMEYGASGSTYAWTLLDDVTKRLGLPPRSAEEIREGA